MEIFDIIHGNIEVCDVSGKRLLIPLFQRLRKLNN